MPPTPDPLLFEWYWLAIAFVAGILVALTAVVYLGSWLDDRERRRQAQAEFDRAFEEEANWLDEQAEQWAPAGEPREPVAPAPEQVWCNKCGWGGWTIPDAVGFYRHPGCAYSAIPLTSLNAARERDRNFLD